MWKQTRNAIARKRRLPLEWNLFSFGMKVNKKRRKCLTYGTPFRGRTTVANAFRLTPPPPQGVHSHTSWLPTRVHQPLKWSLHGVSHHVTFESLDGVRPGKNNPKWRIWIDIGCQERYCISHYFRVQLFLRFWTRWLISRFFWCCHYYK